MKPNLKPEMYDLIQRISTRNTYYGNRIPDSIMKQFTIEENDFTIGILVPYWLSVLEHGRGKRRSNKDSGLYVRIYTWMAKRNMFRSTTEEGRKREARSVTWYINKYGNKQFRNKTYVDVYTTERAKTIEAINQRFVLEISKITTEII